MPLKVAVPTCEMCTCNRAAHRSSLQQKWALQCHVQQSHTSGKRRTKVSLTGSGDGGVGSSLHTHTQVKLLCRLQGCSPTSGRLV